VDGLEFRLLGPLEARLDDAPLDLGGPRARTVLALLVLDANRAVSADRLIEGVWDERAPATAASTLQSYVSRLRKTLGADVVRSAGAGYELRVESERIDLRRFEDLAAAGHDALAAGDARGALGALERALELWRGEPFGDLAYEAWAIPEAARLSELRLAVMEDRLDAELSLGRHGDLVGELELLVARHPLRERVREQLMLALYRAGRQAEALEVFQDARRRLVDELGLDPARSLQELHQAILRQDPGLERPAAADASEGPDPELLGREAELGRLREALDAARGGSGRLAILTGEPGIGKTSLAEALARAAAAAGAAVVWGRCWEAGGAPPFWPWTQVLRAYLGGIDREALRERLGRRLPELAASLPSLGELYPELGTALTLPEDRFAVFSAAAELLLGEARLRPIVIVLDDLHAADEPSLLLLRFIARELTGHPVVVLGLARDGEAPEAAQELLTEIAARAHVRIELGGLPPEGVSTLIERTAGRTPAGELVDSIHADTGGNPLFVAEVARMLAAEDRLAGASTTRVRLPAGVRDVIGRRLRSLSEACRGALVHASVIGREFDVPTLARVVGVGPGELLDPLDEAIGARVLADVPAGLGRFRFAHALMRESIYGELSPARRMRLHQRVGGVLEEIYAGGVDSHLGELAHHFFEAAAVGEATRAAGYAERAARHALAGLAFEEAARLFQLALRALELTGESDSARAVEDLLGLGEARNRAGQVDAARSAFFRAAELARRGDLGEALARAALGIGGLFSWTRQAHDAELVPLIEEALAALGDEDSVMRARLLGRLAGALRDQPTREPRNSLSAEAVEIARRLGDRTTLAYVLDARWGAAWWTENTHERLAIANELVELASGSRERDRAFDAHFQRGSALHELGRPREGDAEIELAVRLADELGQPAHQWLATMHLAMRACSEGRLADSEALFHRAYAFGRESVGQDAVVGLQIQLFLVRREQGRLTEIERGLAASAAEHRNRYPLRFMLAHMHAMLGRIADSRHALAELGDLDALPRDNEFLFALSLLPEVCEIARDLARAEQVYALLEPYADRVACDLQEADMGSVRRPLGLLAAQLGRRDAAVEHLEAAVAHNDELGYRLWAGWSRLALGRMANRPALVEEARGLAEELGLAELLRASSA